jgi:hypothetical protein
LRYGRLQTDGIYGKIRAGLYVPSAALEEASGEQPFGWNLAAGVGVGCDCRVAATAEPVRQRGQTLKEMLQQLAAF